jgi:hypothetical protein
VILAVIDFDGVIAAPWPVEIVAQYPLYAFMNVPPLGYVSPKPAVIQRVEFEKPKLNEYQQLLKDAEKRLYGDKAEHLGWHVDLRRQLKPTQARHLSKFLT